LNKLINIMRLKAPSNGNRFYSVKLKTNDPTNDVDLPGDAIQIYKELSRRAI